MSSRALLNIGMVFVAMVAAIVLYMDDGGPDKPPDHALVPIAQTDIRSIAIERTNSARIELRRDDGTWRMVAPVKARVDETALARVLDLSRLGAANRLAATDLARYGLDQPWGKVRFGEHVLAFGNTNTVTEEIYVQSADAVHTVPARHAMAVPATPGKLIAHRMFAPEEVPVAVELAGFSLWHDGTRWQMTPPDPGLSQDDLVRWIDQWRYASSVVTQPGDPGARTDIVVELRDGRRIELGIKARAPDLVMHRRDEGLDYHFNARTAPLLLGSPSAPANQTP